MNLNTTTPTEGQDTPMSNSASDPTQTVITPTPEVAPSPEGQEASEPESDSQTVENPFQPTPQSTETPSATTVALNVYLDRATDTAESANQLTEYLQWVFVEFVCARKFIFDNKDSQKHEKAMATQRAIINLIKQAAYNKLGPQADKPVAPKVEGGVLQLDAKEIYQHNPQNCDSIDELRQWVLDLQSDNNALVLIHDNLELTIKTLTKLSEEHELVSKDRLFIIDGLNKSISQKRDETVKLAGQVVELTDLLKGNKPLPTPPAPPKAPEASSVFSLNLDVDAEDGICTASIVQDALTVYRDAQLKTAFSYAAKKWHEDAYNSFREYELTQEVLDLLAENIRHLADGNYWAHRYKNDGAGYKSAQRNQAEAKEIGYEYFLTKFCGVTPVEPEEKDESEENYEPTEAELAAYNPEANLTDTQKTIIAKLRTVELPDYFVELVAANFDKRNLLIKNTALEILNNAGAFEMGDVEQSLMDGLKEKGASDADIANYSSILAESTVESEPPYLAGLDEEAKQVMIFNASQGLSVDQLMTMRNYLYPESQEEPLPWEAPTDQDQPAATTQE